MAVTSPTVAATATPTPEPPKTTDEFVLKYYNVDVGDSITFGQYHNRYRAEDIEWTVLFREKNRVLLISTYGISARCFKSTYDTPATWESSDLREWLNGSFLSDGFSKQDQKRILETKVTADSNPDYKTEVGKETKDRVFVLSIDEAEKYFSTNDDRVCVPTTNAKYNEGASGVPGQDGCMWWLRTPGESESKTALVHITGAISFEGFYSDQKSIVVRPAMWVSLEPQN